MKELTVRGVLEFSRNIEMESYTFYTEAGKKFDDRELNAVLADLAEQEMKHYNKFNQLLENTKLTREELDMKVSISKEDHDTLVATPDLPESPSVIEVLETAYKRERNTESVYRTLSTMTNLSEDIVSTFDDLMVQEQGHANRISGLMEKYRR